MEGVLKFKISKERLQSKTIRMIANRVYTICEQETDQKGMNWKAAIAKFSYIPDIWA